MNTQYGDIDRRIGLPELVDFLNANPPGDVFNVQHPAYGARGDGGTDDTLAIQAALDACHAAGGGVVYVPWGVAGIYRINPFRVDSATFTVVEDYSGATVSGDSWYGLRVYSNTRLRARPGVIFQQIPGAIGSGATFYVGRGDSKITIEDVICQGEWAGHTGSSGEFVHGVFLGKCSNVTLRRVTAWGHWGDGLFLGADGYQQTCDGVVLEDCQTYGNRRNSTSYTRAKNVAWRGGTITAGIGGTSPKAGLDIECLDNDFVQENLTFNGVTFATQEGGGTALLVTGNPVRGVRFSDCTLRTQANDTFTVNAQARYALSISASATVNDMLVFDTCTIVGPTGTLPNTRFVNCTARMNSATSGVTQLDLSADARTELDDCEIITSGLAFPFFVSGSTTQAARKVLRNVRVRHIGNTWADVTSIAGLAGYVEWIGGSYTQEGTAPATGYQLALATDGKVRVVDVYMDSKVMLGLFTGVANASGFVSYDWESHRWALGTINNQSTSATRGDAPITVTVGVDHGTQLQSTALTANRAVTLSATNAFDGAEFLFVRDAASTGAFTWDIGTGPLKSLAVSQWCRVKRVSGAWKLIGSGSV